MRFLFVDQIGARSADRIEGRRIFAADDPMRYRPTASGQGAVVAPGAVSEAIGQLASWLCLEKNAFSARPVFLFADRITVTGDVPVGMAVQLHADIAAMDDETFRFSGTASVDGRVVQTITNCSGYFMALAELEDPAESKRRFAALIDGGLTYEGMGGDAYPFETLAGETVELEAGERVKTVKTFSIEEKFYADHFPRFPVTPIVMLNEMIGQATTRLAPSGKRLAVRQIAGIKIRSFVKPGDRVETIVKRVGGDDRYVEAVAEIFKDGRPDRPILRGTYHYEITE